MCIISRPGIQKIKQQCFRDIICLDRSEQCYDLTHIDFECFANISLESSRIGIMQDSSGSEIVDLLFMENNAFISDSHGDLSNFSVKFGSFPIFCGSETAYLTSGTYLEWICNIYYNLSHTHITNPFMIQNNRIGT